MGNHVARRNLWIPVPRFRGGKFTSAKADAGMTDAAQSVRIFIFAL